MASSILADRLKRLTRDGLLTRADDPSHKQKAIYSLTEKAIQLLPLFVVMGAWGRRHLPVTHELSVRARLLEEGGPDMWNAFMDELRAAHLGLLLEHRSEEHTSELQSIMPISYAVFCLKKKKN